MYASTRYYQGNAAVARQLAGRKDEVESIISTIPGFVAYYLIESGDDMISVSVFDDESGAQASNQAAAGWLAENMPNAGVNPPRIAAGEVLLSL